MLKKEKAKAQKKREGAQTKKPQGMKGNKKLMLVF